jgi:hypothetical protein
MIERRRSERIFLRVPITVQAVDQNGLPFAEQTTTLEINRDGARIGLSNSVRLGDEIRVTNLATGFVALFRINLQCPQTYGGLPEWGIAMSPSMAALMPDFWGVAFEDLTEATQPHIAALLACGLCSRQELVAISRPEYEILLQDLVLPRICTVCHVVTDWEPAEPKPSKAGVSGARQPNAKGGVNASTGPEHPTPVPSGVTKPPEAQPASRRATGASSQATPEAPPDQAPPETDQHEAEAESEPSGAERRVARRLPVRVPILVRTSDGQTEETMTRDVSRTGVSFPTFLDLNAGDSIDIVVGYGVVASPTTQVARVAWRRPETKGVKVLVGAHFTAVRGHETADHPAVATRT